MPVFELYNADGSLQLNLGSRVPKILTHQYITAAGAYADAAFTKGQMFYIFNPIADSRLDSYPTVTQNGTTVSWTTPPVPMTLIIGIF